MHPLDTVCHPTTPQPEVARAQITNELNQIFRRLRQYQTEADWISAVLDCASHFAPAIALFSLQDGVLHLRGQRNLQLSEHLSFPVATGAAFSTAASSKDRIVALRTSREVSQSLSSREPGHRAHIVPILNGPRVVGFLFAAEGHSSDVNGLELIAALASTVLERQSNLNLHTQIGSPPAAHSNESSTDHRAAWTQLSDKSREIHVRAQRFARVRTAEMQLSSPEACQAGREQGNLYVLLKREIDGARDAYRKQFMNDPSMIDYLHLELIRSAADGDEQNLGAEYPGQLL